MLGSSIIDIAIGVVFVYLLLSLMVTATSEMIAAWLKRRHDNLWQGMVNLLGEPCANKLYDHALIKSLSPPALLKWANANSIMQKLKWVLGSLKVDAEGPSYIPARTFAVSLLDIVGFKPGSSLESEVRRVLDNVPDRVLDARSLKNSLLIAANSSLAGSADALREFQGFLLTIPDTAAFSTASVELQKFIDANPSRFGRLKQAVASLLSAFPGTNLSAQDLKAELRGALGSPPANSDLLRLLDYIPDSASPAVLREEVLKFLSKKGATDLSNSLPDYLQGTDLEKSLQLLWDEAGHDLEKFKENIGGWFNDAMDRVSGWYKRKTQWVNLVLALGITLAVNVDTILLVNTLSRSSTLRNSLVAQATRFAEQPPAQMQPVSGGASEPPASVAESASSPTNAPFSLSLIPGTVTSGEDVKGTLTVRETNSADIIFAVNSSATNLVAIPATVTISRGQKSAEFSIRTRAVANSARVLVGFSNRLAVLQLTPNPREQLRAARAELESLDLPIGWILDTNKPVRSPTNSAAKPPDSIGSQDAATPAFDVPQSLALPDRNHELFLVLALPTEPLFWKTIVYHWLGWLLTAIAVSLGAPFWFDILNKFVMIRSSGKAPEEKAKPPKEAPPPSGSGPSPAR